MSRGGVHGCRPAPQGPHPTVTGGAGPPLPVVCLSLGGTKLELGALTRDGVYLASAEIHWRDRPAFAGLMDAAGGAGFCDALLAEIDGFLLRNGYRLQQVGTIGLPFPGPCRDGLWYSNNLVRAFRDGLPFEQAMAAALARRLGAGPLPAVRVLGDAQCDAAGELRHPLGRLWDAMQPAMVLNLATGIAAGFVHGGRLLLTDDQFRERVDPRYDAGAGQLGRHLWYYPAQRRWRYHFQPGGAIPAVEAQAIRMTERLSGPALAARLLLLLGRRGLLPKRDHWRDPAVTPADVEHLYRTIEALDPDRHSARAAQTARAAARPIAGAVLAWADRVYDGGVPAAAALCLGRFAREIGAELAAALTTWLAAPGWAPFGRRIVLTGGVGIRFLAASDGVAGKCFIETLTTGLPGGCRVERSRLVRAAERESYIFLEPPPG